MPIALPPLNVAAWHHRGAAARRQRPRLEGVWRVTPSGSRRRARQPRVASRGHAAHLRARGRRQRARGRRPRPSLAAGLLAAHFAAACSDAVRPPLLGHDAAAVAAFISVSTRASRSASRRSRRRAACARARPALFAVGAGGNLFHHCLLARLRAVGRGGEAAARYKPPAGGLFEPAGGAAACSSSSAGSTPRSRRARARCSSRSACRRTSRAAPSPTRNSRSSGAVAASTATSSRSCSESVARAISAGTGLQIVARVHAEAPACAGVALPTLACPPPGHVPPVQREAAGERIGGDGRDHLRALGGAGARRGDRAHVRGRRARRASARRAHAARRRAAPRLLGRVAARSSMKAQSADVRLEPRRRRRCPAAAARGTDSL